ncbi:MULTISPECIES: hypothetical protein [Brachybacterium]|uniref:hypothetical protein n=1 Tax=Brachybacterium TaxID=43668 RepID=UPI0006B5C8D8|nr:MULTISPECIES: hypothetical protein [Brachybacterium]GAP78491.1 hypothetical protein Y09_1319 [Brachybacterium sp. SW0106-09]
MNTHRAVPVSTQEAHPWRSVVRTFVAAAVGVVLAWLVRVLGVDLTPLSQPIIDSLTAAAWVVGTGLVQWLLTRPWAQPVLEVIGLGTGVHTEARALAENVQRSHGDA